MRILAIETSCDETAIAVAELRKEKSGHLIRVLSHHVSSQIEIHAAYGGVVPNLARREHEKNLVPMLVAALQETRRRNPKSQITNYKQIPKSKVEASETILAREPELLRQFKKSIVSLAPPDIDAIAVTYGPGLAPALWTGVNFVRALSHLWNKPVIPVNHMAGHLFSAFLQKSREAPNYKLQITNKSEIRNYEIPKLNYPILALLVSGGHTELVLVKKPWIFKIIGETRDDAAGEAFDKVARILGLKYPGGPEIAWLAEKGDPKKYPLPRPMFHTKDYDFSFSGLKTAVLYLVRDLSSYEAGPHKMARKTINDIAASFQAAAIDVLVKKTMRAAQEYKVKTLALGGGVAANTALRAALHAAVKKDLPDATFFIPDSSLCGDNALMIAAAAYFTGKKMSPKQAMSLRADANARFG